MKFQSIILLVFAFFLIQIAAKGQTDQESNLIQFSGMVLDGSSDELYPIPYVNVAVPEKSRGTYTDFKGFFSIVVEKGDVISFSAVGYKTVEVVIPDSLQDSRYSLVQLLSQDTFNLPETVVFPWPSRDHFKLEFLAMDVTDSMHERALKNLAKDAMERRMEDLSYDGKENASHYLREQAKTYYYIGQTPPMNIFNAVAWKKFFDAWKNGDFKKKKKNDKK